MWFVFQNRTFQHVAQYSFILTTARGVNTARIPIVGEVERHRITATWEQGRRVQMSRQIQTGIWQEGILYFVSMASFDLIARCVVLGMDCAMVRNHHGMCNKQAITSLWN
jgi:hypothetical protein